MLGNNQKHRPNGAAAEGGRPIEGATGSGAFVFFVPDYSIS